MAAPTPPGAGEVEARLADAFLADAFLAACRAELVALKPGNVHVHAPGHRMTVADFETSAAVAAPFIARRGARVGRRVREAMAATVAAVGTNTNLGILLLAAPMLAASERGGAFRPALEAVLRDLDIGDAEEVFAAIRVASPAGLGDAERHDVTAPATVGLREAMAEAADRDRIARQYVTGFSDVLDLGLAEAEAARALGLPPEQVTTAVYFRFAGAFPDSHIVRKFGISAAEAVRRSFVEQAQSLRPYDHDALMTFDADLKARGLNPGTSADLTVATELALRIC